MRCQLETASTPGEKARWTSCRWLTKPLAPLLGGIEIYQSHQHRLSVKKELMGPVSAEGIIVEIDDAENAGACYTTLEPIVRLWEEAIPDELDGQTWWREGEEVIKYAAWLEKADGTNWPDDLTSSWLAKHELHQGSFSRLELRVLRLGKNADGFDNEITALFVVASTEGALATLESAAIGVLRGRNRENSSTFVAIRPPARRSLRGSDLGVAGDLSVVYTRARNVEVTKSFDGLPVHRFVALAPVSDHVFLQGEARHGRHVGPVLHQAAADPSATVRLVAAASA